MFRTLSVFIAFSLMFISCGEEEQELTLNFKLTYDGEPLVMFDNYTYPDGKTINFSRISFYISELELLSGGSSTELVDVDYIDLTMSNIDEDKSKDGYDYIIRNMDELNYDGIRFNIGLTPQMNATLPSEYDSSHPLALTSEYWVGWMSYIFAKIEGNMDFDGDGSLEQGIALHLGADAALRNIEINSLNSDNKINITLDLKDVFEQDSIYDIETTPRIHSLSHVNQTNELMDNMVKSIVVTQ
ncbi:MAG: hypothetical protein HKN09_04630 [Saprospiraceae bacterium]|nr:hypothetical protein [Saprospiraceae bacterium]